MKPLLFTFSLSLLISSCQSNVYQIDGFARDFNDGDTICLRHESASDGPVLITQVSEGKFSFSGATDTIAFCHVFSKKNPESAVDIFLEPERITVELSLTPERNRVSGTTINNTWQLLNDSVRRLGQEVVRTALLPVADSTTQRLRAKTIDSLHRQMSNCILNIACRNSDNPLGQYISQHYKAPEFK